eukprot:3577790-Rhodomonas_salina.1
MVAATCFDSYDKGNSKDTGLNKSIVQTLVRNVKKQVHTKKKFPGYSRPVWVVSLGGYLKITHYLRAHNARFRQHSDIINTTFKRVLAGDQSLHGDIDANASSTNILNRMAREELLCEREGLRREREGGHGVEGGEGGGHGFEDGKGALEGGCGGSTPDHPVMKRAKTLLAVSESHHALLGARIDAAKSVVNFMTELGGVDNSFKAELCLHAKRLFQQCNGSVDTVSALVLNGAVDSEGGGDGSGVSLAN